MWYVSLVDQWDTDFWSMWHWLLISVTLQSSMWHWNDQCDTDFWSVWHCNDCCWWLLVAGITEVGQGWHVRTLELKDGVRCVLCTVYCVLWTLQTVNLSVYCKQLTIYTVNCTVYCVMCTLMKWTLYTVNCTVYKYTVQRPQGRPVGVLYSIQ